MHHLNKKFRTNNRLSDYSGLIPHYYIKVSVVFTLLGIATISVCVLDPFIFREFISVSFNSSERLIIALIAFISVFTVLRIIRDILKLVEDWEKENNQDSKGNFYDKKNEKSLTNLFDKDKEHYRVLESSPVKTKKDIFTMKISNNDALWRVRAYVIGFLLADGTIRTQPYEVSATQNERDKDILINIQNALGGKVVGPDEENKFHLKAYKKELILKLLKFGMVKAHSKAEIAESIHPPNFIMRTILGQSLVRDFVRGFYDGDGWFTGSYSRGDTSFRILGPLNFLDSLKNLILNEVPGLTSFITNERKQYFIVKDQKFQLFSKLTIYKRGHGYHRLTPSDLEKGEIKTLDHPWLKILHFGGNINTNRFFNWLYEDDDRFDTFEIKGMRICGERKFRKVLNEIGDAKFRREKLSPNWKDVLYDTILQMKPRFYKTLELIDLSNSILWHKLDSINLTYLYDKNKVQNRDKFIEKLKFLEFLDNLLISYRSGRDNYYQSKLNPLMDIPSHFTRYIDLIDRNGIKRNIKNLIVLILIGKSLKLNDIISELRCRNVFHKHTLTPKNIRLSIAQLKSFDIIIADDDRKELEKQRFIINTSVLYRVYNMNAILLKEELSNLLS